MGEDEHVELSEVLFFYRCSYCKKKSHSYAPSEEKVFGWRTNLAVPTMKRVLYQAGFSLIERFCHLCRNVFFAEVELCLHNS